MATDVLKSEQSFESRILLSLEPSYQGRLSKISINIDEQTKTAVWQVSLRHNSNNCSKLTKFYRGKAAPARPKSPIKRQALRHSQSMPTWAYDHAIAEHFRATGQLHNPHAPSTTVEYSPFLDLSAEPPYANLINSNGRREAARTTFGQVDDWNRQATAANRAGGHVKGARLTARQLGKLILCAEDRGTSRVPDQNTYWDTPRAAPHGGVMQGRIRHPYAYCDEIDQEPEYQRSFPMTMQAEDQIPSAPPRWKGKGRAVDPEYKAPTAPPYPPEMQEWLTTTYVGKTVTPKPSLSSVRQRAVSSKAMNHPDSLKPANGRLHHSRSQPRIKNVTARQPEIVDVQHRTSFRAVVGMAPVPPVPPLPNMGPYQTIPRRTVGRPSGPRPLPPIPRK